MQKLRFPSRRQIFYQWQSMSGHFAQVETNFVSNLIEKLKKTNEITLFLSQKLFTRPSKTWHFGFVIKTHFALLFYRVAYAKYLAFCFFLTL